MKFKTLFFSLCLFFVSAASFAATVDTTFPTDDEPLTLKEANKTIETLMASFEEEPDVKLLKVASILRDDAECTVTVNIDIAGNGGSVSATAATCREALNMIIDII